MKAYWATGNDAEFSGLRYLAAKGLRGGSWLYRAAWGLRQASFRAALRKVEQLPCAVISVGNLTVGGTGKTPMTRTIAEMLQTRGVNVAVVSRGYGGRAGGGGARGRVREVSNRGGVLMTPDLAGDEPVLLARQLPGTPVLIGARRATAGRRCLSLHQSEVIVLDDGYQHQALYRDCNILLVNADRPLGNGCLLPRGPLREPLAALQRADCVIVTMTANESDHEARQLLLAEQPAMPLFLARFEAVDLLDLPGGAPRPLNRLQESAYVAFCGLARPERFRSSLAALPGRCVGFERFADHHRYTASDVTRLAGIVERTEAHFLLTTEKDAVKLEVLAPLPVSVFVLRMTYRFETTEPPFETWLMERLNERRRGLASRSELDARVT